jgi:hypothetical protein
MVAESTTAEVARLLNQPEWRIRRLFTDATLPEPRKFGGKRVITSDLIPRIVDALRERGWLSEMSETVSP